MPSIGHINPKWEKFALIYAATGSGRKAWLGAGYNGRKWAAKSGRIMRNKPVIRHRINELVTHSMSILGIEKDYVLGGIKEIADDTEAFDRDRLTALFKLGEYLALWKEKRPVGEDPELARLDTIGVIKEIGRIVSEIGPAATGELRALLEPAPQAPEQIPQQLEEAPRDVCGEPGGQDLRRNSGGHLDSNGVASISESPGDSEQGMDCRTGQPDDADFSDPDAGRTSAGRSGSVQEQD